MSVAAFIVRVRFNNAVLCILAVIQILKYSTANDLTRRWSEKLNIVSLHLSKRRRREIHDRKISEQTVTWKMSHHSSERLTRFNLDVNVTKYDTHSSLIVQMRVRRLSKQWYGSSFSGYVFCHGVMSGPRLKDFVSIISLAVCRYWSVTGHKLITYGNILSIWTVYIAHKN